MEITKEHGGLLAALRQEWSPPGTSPAPVKQLGLPWDGAILSYWGESLENGQIVTAIPAELESAIRGKIDARIRSMIFIPIVVSDTWWGVVGLDDFVQDRKWGDAERDSLRAVADMLGASIARQRVQKALLESKATLEQRVTERTSGLQEQIKARDRAHAELAAAQQRLIELSRVSGMADVATGVLHNVGNVLNSVNVSATLVPDRIRAMRVANLGPAIQILSDNAGHLDQFLDEDPKGVRLVPYLAKLSEHLKDETVSLVDKLTQLTRHVGHIKEIVPMQQNYARTYGVTERMEASTLMEDTLRIVMASYERHGAGADHHETDHRDDGGLDRSPQRRGRRQHLPLHNSG